MAMILNQIQHGNARKLAKSIPNRSIDMIFTKRIGVTSKYKGVYWFKPFKRWCACINVNGKRISLKYYKSEEDAARAYNEAAKKYFGEFAKLNDV